MVHHAYVQIPTTATAPHYDETAQGFVETETEFVPEAELRPVLSFVLTTPTPVSGLLSSTEDPACRQNIRIQLGKARGIVLPPLFVHGGYVCYGADARSPVFGGGSDLRVAILGAHANLTRVL